ncbi:MOS1T transposase, partial [Pseudoatta argentina]
MTFSKIASLNGVHMFLKSQDITLLSTDLPDVTVAWKEFERCIILIAIASGVTKYVLDKFLDATFGAMILFTGIDEIKNTKNIERLKKDMRLCSPIIDRLMDCLDIGDKISTKTDMINMTECIISSESHLLQVAFRLVSVTLINHVEVLALCGPNPELTEMERYAMQCWKNNMDALCTVEQCYPRNLPMSVSLDSETLGVENRGVSPAMHPEKRPLYAQRHDKVILLHDNARPHVAKPVKIYLETLKWEVLPHPPYSPDIAPSDFHLFRSMAHGLADWRFHSYEEAQKWIDSWIASKDMSFFLRGIHVLPERWSKVVESDGKYFH